MMINLTKKIVNFVLITILTVSFWSGVASANSAKNEVIVKIDGQVVYFADQNPIIQKGRTLVPLRVIFEKLGAEVEWEADTKTVIATKDEKTISLTEGNLFATVISLENGKKRSEVITLDVPAQIANSRTLVPLRFVSEALGAEVEWEAQTKTVLITTGEVKKESGQDYTVQEMKTLQEQYAKTLRFEDGVLKGTPPVLREGYEWRTVFFVDFNSGGFDQLDLNKKLAEGVEFSLPVDHSKVKEATFRIEIENTKEFSRQVRTILILPANEMTQKELY